MIWYKEPRILFVQSKAQYFFPQDWMSHEERQNALARLVLYTAALLFVLRKDAKVFILAALALAALYLVDTQGSNSEKAAHALGMGASQGSGCTVNPSLLDPRPRCDGPEPSKAPQEWPLNDQGFPMQHMGIKRATADRHYQVPMHNQGQYATFLSQPSHIMNNARGQPHYALRAGSASTSPATPGV